MTWEATPTDVSDHVSRTDLLLGRRGLELDRCPTLGEEHLGSDGLGRGLVEECLAVAGGEHGQLELEVVLSRGLDHRQVRRQHRLAGTALPGHHVQAHGAVHGRGGAHPHQRRSSDRGRPARGAALASAQPGCTTDQTLIRDPRHEWGAPLLQAILLTVLACVAMFDALGPKTLMLSRPLLAGTAAGIIVGHATLGMAMDVNVPEPKPRSSRLDDLRAQRQQLIKRD